MFHIFHYIFFIQQVSVNKTMILLFKHPINNLHVLWLLNSELLSKQRQDIFWDFIEIWHNAEKDAVHSHSAKDCVKKIVEHGRPLLREPLTSLFEFSLILRSASPRLVLYRQLAGESLSSFPLGDESYSNNDNVETAKTEEKMENRKSDPLHVVDLKSPAGKCCWVDNGDQLFFHVSELLLWLQSPAEL